MYLFIRPKTKKCVLHSGPRHKLLFHKTQGSTQQNLEFQLKVQSVVYMIVDEGWGFEYV